MKNTNDESVGLETRSNNKLESLPADKKEIILELATHTRQIDMITILKEHGIEVSASTLSRFMRRYRETRVLEDGDDMKVAVEALAGRGRGESLRKGTMEALRQKMYELAVNSNDPEAARELYRDILKEEAKLKELELEQRKTAAMEEGVKLQRLRIEVMAAGKGIGNSREGTSPQLRDRQRAQRSGMVIDAGPVVAGELPGPGERQLVEGKNLAEGKQGKEGEDSTGGRGENRGELEQKLARFDELWRRMGEVLNRSGRAEEKVLGARAVWEEGRMRIEGERAA